MRTPFLPLGTALLFLGAVLTPAHAEPGGGADTREDEQLLKSSGVLTDGQGLLEFFRARTLTAADSERVSDLVRRLGNRSFPVREKASADLVTLGPPRFRPWAAPSGAPAWKSG